MTQNERQEILTSLKKGSAALLDALHSVTESLAERVPALERWSILQCIEHVALGENFLFSLIRTAKLTNAPLINEQHEILIDTRGADRSVRRESPPDALPRGSFSTLHEALQSFLASRERTIRFVSTNVEDLRSRITSHPLLGTVNCHEILLLMAVHPARHAKQIEEIKAAAAN